MLPINKTNYIKIESTQLLKNFIDLFIKANCLEEIMYETYQIQRYNKLTGDIQKFQTKILGALFKQSPHIGKYPNS